MLKLVALLILFLIVLNARAGQAPTWWCTASGITLTYAKEQVWGSDQLSLPEAKAHALSNCRAELSQCAIDQCWQRKGDTSYEESIE